MTKKTANDIVQLARDNQRITTRELIGGLVDGFIECHGDRYYGDDKAIIGGIGLIEKIPVTVIGIQKGQTLEENVQTKFGSPTPEGYRKALRLMKQAEKFKRPIITLVNTPGAFCGIEAEERGEGEAIAKNLYEMSQLKVPILSILTGEGGSGGALALAVANDVWMLENSIYSILSPEGFASILWKDSSRASEAAEIMKLTAPDLKKLGVIDKIIRETDDIGELSKSQLIGQLKQKILKQLDYYKTCSTSELQDQRYERFRKF
ncbi:MULTISPECIES: acetyl-CoA carboxylase carboxyl transferase subunit alpha [Enterococcaceae]|uniref:acetyl-CoA carboxylase carboxyl transferase subunit alpha n=1 Tax=Enterococcaceae TaxID=81852 RepID=UPI000E498AA7|nr:MULTISPECIES: acetyl-CoA carboxylase carboxyl transferase subunit alpha [Enterococcaceae]MCI0129981.1 acetyl-CoA carboxylase carboxyl transferase subunit alpha [Vagococcus sp. CY53-2]RGI30864.1 acetyl-CoA carboxylase carboxyl transferase subunit alpha [Melissococcus sp. OM08-11BH]UNM88828.1 acetyl-CoA carboxylase carboxyl transferase subunit alpha [Vagococcus sp. CY52-2]